MGQSQHRSEQGNKTGTINNMTALRPPVSAVSKNTGEPVRILTVGDVEGFSPACWVVDQSGEITLESLSTFRVDDPNYKPTIHQRSGSGSGGSHSQIGSGKF